MSSEARRAPRLVINAPCVIESIGQASMSLHPNLARVFRRVDADRSSIGSKFPAVIRDLSTNGAFISGAPLPLLARVALKFDIKGVGNVEALEVKKRFRLPWKDVVRVVASPSTHTCFVDGGAPAKSLLVPGVGAPAPYSIIDREGLYAEILAHVDPAKVTEVATLEAR